MKRPFLFVSAAGIILLGGLVYAYRFPLLDWVDAMAAPKLPKATHVVPRPSLGENQANLQEASPVEGGSATSERYVLVSNPPRTNQASELNPLERSESLPAEVNLDVPFASQAPYQDWSLPYQEACEEASAIMVDAYYQGQGDLVNRDDAVRQIKELAALQTKMFGYYLDTSAKQTAEFIKAYYKYTDVRILPVRNAEDIQRAVANGYPVIIPADGKLLPNPNFRNGGPIYHMLVVKGYSKGKFITNDPGTRKGKNFLYTYDALLQAAHDWDGKAAKGPAVMIIVMPRSS